MSRHSPSPQFRHVLAKPIQNQQVQKIAQLFEQGYALHQQGKMAQAKAIYEQLLVKQPKHFYGLYLLGLIAAQSNNPALTAELMGKAIVVEPDYVDAHYNRSVALQELKLWPDALASYDKTIAIKPDHANAHANRGVVLKELILLDEAIVSFDNAIVIKPDYADAYSNRGVALKELMRLDEAVGSFDKAIAFKPDHAEAYSNRGVALKELMRLDEAVGSFDKAIAFKPDYADAYNNRGVALNDLMRREEAVASFDRAITIKPDHADAYNNRGVALNNLMRREEAVASFDRAITIKPDHADAYSNRGNTLLALKRLDEAVASFDRAIAIKPDHAEAYSNRGIALQELILLDEAVASFDNAIAIQADFADAYSNRGNVLVELKRWDAAIASYEAALKLKPESEFLFSLYLHIKMDVCDWGDLSKNIIKLEKYISENKKASSPFDAITLIDKPAVHQRVAKIFSNAKYPQNHVLGTLAKRNADGKIRIGYYSTDFKEHPVSYLMSDIFELHDKNKFEIVGFSLIKTVESELKNRLINSCDRFIDVHDKSDREIAEMSRSIGIDIAVDLGGYTKYCRTAIFSYRLAPVQLSYIGYLGTMGSEYYDYIIADDVVIPKESSNNYSESIAYIPSYQANGSKRIISQRFFTRQELSLPENGFVFCCFNNSYKILPATFYGWMRILESVGSSVLFLLGDNKWAEINLKKEAEAMGISGERLVFGSRLSHHDYLARYRVCDLFLDTLPYNAGTTASDALWAGLPVLTCTGKSFASRMAASLLTAIEMPELINHTQKDYEAQAIELANNPAMLQDIKTKLMRNRLTTPLFDGQLFTMHIEAAYETMYARSQSGLPPENFEVQRLCN